jgi:hypothetical protein
MSVEVSDPGVSNIPSPGLHATPWGARCDLPVIIELRCDEQVSRHEHALVGWPSLVASGQPVMSHRTALFVYAAASFTALVVAGFARAAQAQSVPLRDKLHDHAVASFQQGRFPEAYGRFMALADAGHAPAAELALFMAQNSTAVFGKDWDVTQEQLTAWAALTGKPAPVLQARIYAWAGVQAGARGRAAVALR